ncbi:MAG: DUF402 domain-containing protein [Candidatus Odinarchaeota archaeon]|nr:DUF402 domain-containing protein [Candidatus Odinarchaeota archaeon]
MKYRIRGIYSTALTAIFLDAGHEIVQATPIICKRFGINENNIPPDATIKDSESSKDSIIIVGFPDAVEEAVSILKHELPFSVFWVSELPLHGIVKGIVKERTPKGCIVDIGDGYEGFLPERNYNPGDVVIASVVKPPMKFWPRAQLSTSIRIIGSMSEIVYKQQKVTLSRHITNKEKRDELIKLGKTLMNNEWGIHWRSSARFASTIDLIDEVHELVEKGSKILDLLKHEDRIGLYYTNELIAEVAIPYNSKSHLDKIRSKVTTTIDGHHWGKADNKELSNIVDFSEIAIENGADKSVLSNALKKYTLNLLLEKKVISFVHQKLNGYVTHIGPAKIISLDGLKLITKRIMKRDGYYDGLGVKKEAGDVAISEMKLFSNFIVHQYYSKDGNLKGIYVNINSPIEPTIDGIKYIDYLVDVVATPNFEPRVVDVDDLNQVKKKGIITETFYDYVIHLLDDAKKIALYKLQQK